MDAKSSAAVEKEIGDGPDDAPGSAKTPQQRPRHRRVTRVTTRRKALTVVPEPEHLLI